MQRILHALLLTLLFLVSAPRAAHADLIDLGDGLIYDTVQDLTWLDPYFWNPGDTTWDQANTLVSDLTHAGLSDWRLPYMSLRFPGPFDGTQNEFLGMVQQLGWYFPCTGSSGGGGSDFVADRVADRSASTSGACTSYGDLIQTDNYGPFQAPFYYHHTWVDVWPYYTDMFMGSDFPDNPDVAGGVPSFTFAVRNGAPDGVTVHSVPEPGSWALVTLGGVMALAAGTRRRRAMRR